MPRSADRQTACTSTCAAPPPIANKQELAAGWPVALGARADGEQGVTDCTQGEGTGGEDDWDKGILHFVLQFKDKFHEWKLISERAELLNTVFWSWIQNQNSKTNFQYFGESM